VTLGGLRARTLLAVFGVSAVVLLLVAVLIAVPMRAQLLRAIERNLVAEARLSAALLREHQTDGSLDALDREADQIGAFTAARVTLIAADGRVVGDSAAAAAALHALDNHGTRPEVVTARRSGLGIERRFSATVGIDLLYVAIPVEHPHVAVVRLALPLTDVEEQFRGVRRSLVLALALALASALGWRGCSPSCSRAGSTRSPPRRAATRPATSRRPPATRAGTSWARWRRSSTTPRASSAGA
jgi:two-component system phosphate regulon sensor histidine kinase PhoR